VIILLEEHVIAENAMFDFAQMGMINTNRRSYPGFPSESFRRSGVRLHRYVPFSSLLPLALACVVT
jgi:hypothetical protein